MCEHVICEIFYWNLAPDRKSKNRIIKFEVMNYYHGVQSRFFDVTIFDSFRKFASPKFMLVTFVVPDFYNSFCV